MKRAKDINSYVAEIPIASAGKIPAPKIPKELMEALGDNPKARELWSKITPIARRGWILWITSAKKAETSTHRVAVACSKLSSGKRRVCCFGGVNWLIKMNQAKRPSKTLAIQ